MALELNNTQPSKKSETEAADIIAGADDQRLIQAGETFAANIVAFVVNGKGTVTNVLANDTSSTDVVGAGAGAEGYLNISGVDLEPGAFFAAGKYSKGDTFTSITTGTASVIAYYKYTLTNINA